MLCAYLRMPHTTDDAEPAGFDPDRELRRTQERQVRLTAQRLLTTHLQRGRPADAYWPDITLDLAGATLLDLNLDRCHLHGATFDGARFHGVTQFSLAEFTGPVSFDNARFTDNARFINTVWAEPADLTGARFDREVNFAKATFRSNATFDGTHFEGDADFRVRDSTLSGSTTRALRRQPCSAVRGSPAVLSSVATSTTLRISTGALTSVPRSSTRRWFSPAHASLTRSCSTMRSSRAFVGFDEAVFADSAIFTKTKLLAEARFRNTRFNGGALFGGWNSAATPTSTAPCSARKSGSAT